MRRRMAKIQKHWKSEQVYTHTTLLGCQWQRRPALHYIVCVKCFGADLILLQENKTHAGAIVDSRINPAVEDCYRISREYIMTISYT